MARATDEMLFARHRDITNDSWKGDFDFQCPERVDEFASQLCNRPLLLSTGFT